MRRRSTVGRRSLVRSWVVCSLFCLHFAGLRGIVPITELENRRVVVVTNFKPRRTLNFESNVLLPSTRSISLGYASLCLRWRQLCGGAIDSSWRRCPRWDRHLWGTSWGQSWVCVRTLSLALVPKSFLPVRLLLGESPLLSLLSMRMVRLFTRYFLSVSIHLSRRAVLWRLLVPLPFLLWRTSRSAKEQAVLIPSFYASFSCLLPTQTNRKIKNSITKKPTNNI